MIRSWCFSCCTILALSLADPAVVHGRGLGCHWGEMPHLLVGDRIKHFKVVVCCLKSALLWISYAKDKKLFKIASMIIHDYSFAAVLVFHGSADELT